MIGAGLAIAAGAWFTVGTLFTPLFPTTARFTAGTPAGISTVARVSEQLGFFTGLGLVIVFVGALALGRLSVVGLVDARLAGARRRAAEEEEAEADEAETEAAERRTEVRAAR
jgi:hypothetical protein